METSAITINDWRNLPGKLEDGEYKFPVITSKNANGKHIEWQIVVRLIDSANPDIFLPILDEYLDNKPIKNIYGWIKTNVRTGMDGMIHKSEPTIVKTGKNIGRVNETNVVCQSLRDALGIYNKQLRKSSTAIENNRYPPMLAQYLKDQKKDPFLKQGNIYVQRKYNGLRAVATYSNDTVIMYSRAKLLYNGFDYIKQELAPILKYYWEEGKELYIDGEAYRHDTALQDISGWSRRGNEKEDEMVDFMVYDIFIANQPELTYSKRLQFLEEIFEDFTHFKHVKKVDTYKVNNREEVDKYYNQFLAEDFEGAMVRLDEPYMYSYNSRHSKYLLKVKPFYDAEYTCIGYTTGEKGKAADAIMFICETDNGIKFNVTPAMTLIERNALSQKMEEIGENNKSYFDNVYRGNKLIIVYDELSKDGVPQRARTNGIIRMWD